PTWLNTIGATSPARIAIKVITTSSSMRVKPRLLGIGDTQHLLDGRDARLNLCPAVLTERPHALLGRERSQGGRVRAAQERLLHGFADDEELENPGAAAVAGPATRGAAPPVLQHGILDRVLGEERHRPGVRTVALAALGA